jgi:hypothetical protein
MVSPNEINRFSKLAKEDFSSRKKVFRVRQKVQEMSKPATCVSFCQSDLLILQQYLNGCAERGRLDKQGRDIA